MNIFLISLVFLLIIFINIKIKRGKTKNQKINKFKNKFLSNKSNIEKIFLRDDEKTSSNPNINISIGPYAKEENINRKLNIHRARLSKFKKSMLNGEMIYVNDEEKIFKYINGRKIYL